MINRDTPIPGTSRKQVSSLVCEMFANWVGYEEEGVLDEHCLGEQKRTRWPRHGDHSITILADFGIGGRHLSWIEEK